MRFKQVLYAAGALILACTAMAASPTLDNGIYAVLREAPSAEQMEPIQAPHVTLKYQQKGSVARYVALDTSTFVPLVFTAPPAAKKDQRGQAMLEATLASKQAKALESLTRAHLDRPIAVVIDGEIITMPRVRSVIDNGQVKITGCEADGCEGLRAKLIK